MQSRYIAGLCAAVFSAGMTGTGADQPLNVRLGYPADSKLLIINADDLAMSHSENDASLTAFDNKLITSATVMVPSLLSKAVRLASFSKCDIARSSALM